MIKLVSKSLQSARQRLAAYKQSSALQEKKQRPCHIGSKSREQGRGPFNGMKKGHPGFYAWVSFFSFLREVRGRAYLLRSVRPVRWLFPCKAVLFLQAIGLCPTPHFSAAASVGRWATSHRDVTAL